MNKRLFTDWSIEPTDSLLRKQMGSAMNYYSAVLSKLGKYRKQWQFSQGNGWILRAHDNRKALFYLIPLEDEIDISLTVRDAEREGFLQRNDFEEIYPQLESATKYSGGYAIRFGIESFSECKSVTHFLTELIKMRSVC